MLKTQELIYQDEELTVRLVLGAASVLAGMKRAILSGRATAFLESQESQAAGTASVAATARNLIAQTLYPDCLAAIVEAEGLDAEMDVAAFLQLPEELTDTWQNAVYDLNPHWYPFRRNAEDEEQADEKKAPLSVTSVNDS